jgi:chromate transport protein ChrA
VRARAAQLFPFAIAVILPPAGLILGLLAVAQDDRDLGLRLVIVSALAAVVWAILIAAR